MTALKIAEILGITEGTKVIEFQEPVKFPQGIKQAPGMEFSITSARVIKREGWNDILLGGTYCPDNSRKQTDCCLGWYQLSASERVSLEKAILKFNA